jgi:hypothetical protein
MTATIIKQKLQKLRGLEVLKVYQQGFSVFTGTLFLRTDLS